MTKKIFLLTSVAVMSAMMFTGCAQDDTRIGGGPVVDITTFNVVSFSPGYDTTIGTQTEEIIAAFSMPVDFSSLIGNYSLIRDVDGTQTNLTDCLELNTDTTGSIVTFKFLAGGSNSSCPAQPLADIADYTFNINQTVRPLGLNMGLSTPISHKFNTGGGFQGNNGAGLTILPGPPSITSVNYYRNCYIDAAGQQVETAFIDIQFSESLRFPPLIQIQQINDGVDQYAQPVSMTQATVGDMTLMRIQVPSIGGFTIPPWKAGYRVKLENTFVVDFSSTPMANTYESGELTQFAVSCN